MMRKIIKIAYPKDEWIRDFYPTREYLESLDADIFSFWQRFPDTKPRYRDLYMEWDNVAVLEVKSFEDWWKKIGKKTRNMVRKAEKKGVMTRIVKPDDRFFMGVTQIYNEKPFRQGKPFRHYGKSFRQVKSDFTLTLNQSTFLGAYFNGKLIGFAQLLHTDKYTLLSQILSLETYREKAPMNALIAKSVEVCAEKNIRYIVYGKMSAGGLGDFKRHNGFQKKLVPRYYIPLSTKGKVALTLGLHKSLVGSIPEKLKDRLVRLRAKFRMIAVVGEVAKWLGF